MTAWRDAPFIMGGNDTFNDCTETCCANAYILHATLAGNPVAMEDAEVERFDSILTGFNPHEGDDQGVAVETALAEWCRDGWPGDPIIKPSGYRPVALDGLRDALTRCQGAPSWIMLPMTADGTGYDFSDDAVTRDAPGVGAHAVLVVQADDFGVVFITWGKPQGVSWDGARGYWRGSFEVEWGVAA